MPKSLTDLFPETNPDPLYGIPFADEDGPPTGREYMGLSREPVPAPPEITVEDLLSQRFAYLTGPAGTGKTYLARQVIAQDPGAQLCATTGIAAVNLGDATTINSFLRYFDTASLLEAYTSGYLQMQLRKLRRSGLTRIVLDEISMMPADQLTYLVRAIDEVNNTAGYDEGIQDYRQDDDALLKELGLLLCGDFCQLGPVKAPFAFDSPEWPRFRDHTFKLTTVRRQGDRPFIEALQAVRRGDARAALETFRPTFVDTTDIHFDGTTIVAKNESVDRINNLRHDSLKGELLTYATTRSGEQETEWKKQIPDQVRIKVGALVMVLANRAYPRLDLDDPPTFEYVNGDLATVIGRGAKGGCQVMLHRTFAEVEVGYATREKRQTTGKKKPPYEVKGAITYMPLRLAYASTTHKTQGLSLDACQVSLTDHFMGSPGMVYVALSRCRSLEGLRIVGNEQLFLRRVATDPQIKEWV